MKRRHRSIRRGHFYKDIPGECKNTVLLGHSVYSFFFFQFVQRIRVRQCQLSQTY
jgi:hypothetical protein